MRKVLLAIGLALPALQAPYDAWGAVVSGPSVEGARNAKKEKHRKAEAAFWKWQGELIKKGRFGKLRFHPVVRGLVEGTLQARDLKSRAVAVENGLVPLRIQFEPSARIRLAELVAEIGGLADILASTDAIVRLPVESLQRLEEEPLLKRIRPIISSAAVAVEVGRPDAIQKLRSPFSGEMVEVFKQLIAVGFVDGIDRDTAERILASYGCSVVSFHEHMVYGKYVARCRDEDDLLGVLFDIGGDPDVSYVNLQPVVRLALTPNDPRFTEQWNLHNSGTAAQLSGRPDADIDGPEAWSVHSGGDAVIAIIDTGIDLQHEDLRTRLWTNPREIPNNFDDDFNGYVDDIHGYDFRDSDANPEDREAEELGVILVKGHGTYVSGVAAAASNNGVGITGVNWGAKIMALKVLSDGDNNQAQVHRVTEAILYAARNGARVINLSLVVSDDFQPEVEVALTEAYSKGVVIVAASGNDKRDWLPYPASSNLVIAVGATDKFDRRADFSNGGFGLDLVAPGVDILTTRVGNRYIRATGTSFAAPHVSAAVALARSLAPALSPAELEQLLLSSADLVDGQVGWSFGYGHGRLNLEKVALAARLAGDPAPPVIEDVLPSNGATVGPRPLISAGLRDLGSGIESATLELDGVAVASVGVNAVGIAYRPEQLLSTGTHIVRVTATDRAGRTASVNWQFFSVPDETPPSVPIVVDDGQTTVDSWQLHASWSSADPESGIAEYFMAIGESPGGTEVRDYFPLGNATQATVSGLSLQKGKTYYVSILSVNNAQLVSDVGSSDGIAVENIRPVANADGPYSAFAGQEIALDGTMSFDSDGDSLTYSWDFGDGTTGAGPRPIHTYLAPVGNYTVSLVVSDGKIQSVPSTSTVFVSQFQGISRSWTTLSDFALGAGVEVDVVSVPSSVPNDGGLELHFGSEELLFEQPVADREYNQLGYTPCNGGSLIIPFTQSVGGGYWLTGFAPFARRTGSPTSVDFSFHINGTFRTVIAPMSTASLGQTLQFNRIDIPAERISVVNGLSITQNIPGSYFNAGYDYFIGGSREDVLPGSSAAGYSGYDCVSQNWDWAFRLWGRRYSANGEFISEAYDVGTSSVSYGPFQAGFDYPSMRATVAFFTQSSSDGMNWESEKPALVGRFIESTPRRFLRWIARPATTDRAYTATIHEVSINFREFDAPPAPVSLTANGGNPSPWTNASTFTVSWQNPSDPSGIAGSIFRVVGHEERRLTSTNSVTLDFMGQLAQGENLLTSWLRDGVGNENESNSASVVLRYDSLPPLSEASSPVALVASPVPVTFSMEDQAGLSGAGSVTLWFRRDSNGDGVFGAWQRTASMEGAAGIFQFSPDQAGEYQFYTQAQDRAGNREPEPDGATAPKTRTFFDSSTPQVYDSRAQAVSFNSAEVAWTSDDDTSAIVEYGTSTAFSRSVNTSLGKSHLATLDCQLLSPATIYYRITSTNRTGLSTVSAIYSFATPLNISVPTDSLGLLDANSPIELYVSNPLLNFVSLQVADGVSITTSVVLPDGVTRFTALVDGLTINAYFPFERPSQEFVHPMVVSAGGLITQPGAPSIAEIVTGETVAGPLSTESSDAGASSGGSRLYTGLLSRMDPISPAAISVISVLPGPNTGQLTLGWTSTGDDGSVGTAMSYDLRIASNPITQANFPAAASIALPAPLLAGSQQDTILSGLDATTTYYFALKAVDELLNAPAAVLAYGRPLALAEPVAPVPGEVLVIQLSSAVTQPPPAPSIQIAIASGASVSGWQTLSIAINDFKFTTQFLVDTATRAARLARLSIDAASVITDTAATPGSSMADFAAGQAVAGPVSQAMPMQSGYSALELGHYVGVDPVAPGAPVGLQVTPGPSAGQLTVAWTAPGDDATAGTAMEYDLRLSQQLITAGNFSAATRVMISTLPAMAGGLQQAVISGLADGAEYFVALKAIDELLNESQIAASGAVRTSQAVASADTLSGRPVVEFFSTVQGVTITAVSTTTTNPAVALATSEAAAQGLLFASGLYDIVSPDPSLPGGATVQFRYADLGDSSLEAGMRIYHFKPALGQWILLADVGPDTINDLFTAPVASLSFFAVFLKDRAPPVSTIHFVGGRQLAQPSSGLTFVSTDTRMAFEASDAPFGRLGSSGVDRIEYLVDSASTFSRFDQPFGLSEGAHSIRFRGLDHAGNQEVLRGVIINVDGTGPRITMDFDRPFQRLLSGIIAVPDQEGTVRLTIQDPSGSGFKKADVTLDSQSEAAGAVFERHLALGRHSLRVVAEDNLGNTSEMSASIVIGDLLPPDLVSPADGFATSASSMSFSWTQPSGRILSLEAYDLLISTNQDLLDDSLAAQTTAQIPVAVAVQDPLASLQNLTIQNGQAVLITNVVPGQPQSGTTAGVWETPFITLPQNVQRITGFQPTQALEQGTILYEFTVDGVSWVNIAYLPYTSYFPLINGAPRIKFRATLARQTLSQTSPRLSAIFFIAIRGAGFPTFIAATNASNTLLDLERSSDWVRLITVIGPAQTTGTLTGTWTGPAIPIPAGAFKVVDLNAHAYGGQGAIDLRYSTDDSTYQDVASLDALDLSTLSGHLRFRAVLSRASLSDATPVFGGISFNFALPPPTTATIALPGEGKYFWAVRSRDFAGRVSENSQKRAFAIDRTSPTVIIGSPMAGQTFVVSRSSVAIALSVLDTLDPHPVVAASLHQLADRGAPRGERPALVSVTTGQVLNPAELDDGVWELRVTAQDLAGNASAASSGPFEVVHDAKPPMTSLSISTPQASGDPHGTIFVTRRTTVRLTSLDDLAEAGDALGLGVAFQALLISGVHRSTFTNAATQFGAFSSTFTLLDEDDGFHQLSFYAQDILGNTEDVKVATVAVDNTPPLTTLALSGAVFGSYVSSSAVVSLSAADSVVNHAAAGIDRTRYRINGEEFRETPSSFTLAGPDGVYALEYQSLDRLQNEEILHSSTVLLDQTAPRTQLVLMGGRQHPSDDGAAFYASSDTRFVLASDDPEVNGVASGLAAIEFKDDQGDFQAYTSTFALGGGVHLLAYRGRDNVDNLEVLRSTTVLVDATAPLSAFEIGAPSYGAADGTRYIGPATPVAFTATDPEAEGVAARVDRIEVSVDGAGFVPYIAALTFAEGRHVVLFRAIDRVGNVESARALHLLSDDTPPQTSLEPGAAFFTVAGADGPRNYAPLHFTYTLPAVDPLAKDVASGVAFTRFRIGHVASDGSLSSGPLQPYSTAFSLIEGIRVVEFQSQDNVDNLELPHSATVFVDATAAVSALAIGLPRFDPGPGLPVFVGPGTTLSLSAQDPVVDGVASGVREISFRRGGDALAVYEAPFTLPLPAGVKTIEYFSWDNVGNAEARRSTTVALDDSPPQTALAVHGGVQYPGPDASSFYASSDTRFSFLADDSLVNGVASGLASTRYQDNAGQFLLFALSSTIGLPEGPHLLGYQSLDRVDNMEVLRSTTILVDATPPVTRAHIGSPLFVAADGTNYVAPATPVTFSATDPVLPGGRPGSEVLRTEVALDGGPFVSYSEALRFTEGRHQIIFRSVDNVGNVEGAQTLEVLSDETASQTALAVLGGKQTFGGASQTFYASSDTRFALVASDPVVRDVASGVEFVEIQDNGGAFQTVASVFGLAEGGHELRYRSRDNVQNLEVLRSTTVLIDATAPISTYSIGAPHFRAADGTNFVTPTAPVTFSAVDPLAAGVASQVESIEVSIDGAGFTTYTAPLTFKEGRHVVLFRSIDRVGNVETARTLELQSDDTPPLTSFRPSGELYTVVGTEGARSYAPPAFSYALLAADPVAKDVASGVASTWYRTAAGALRSYSGVFTLDEGIRRVDFQSRDNVDNEELVRGATVFVDATAPVSSLAIGLPRYDPGSGQPVFVAAKTVLSLSAQDPVVQEVASGVRQISFRRDADATAAYEVPFTLTGVDGVKEVEYLAKDNVGNAETARSNAVALDATSPETALAVVGGAQFPGPDSATFYASSDTRFAFAAVDPIINGVGSGLSFTEFQDGDGAFERYGLAFGLSEGAHELRYRSQDRVDNLEVPRSTTVLLDASAPLSVSHIGTPSFESADGSIYIVPTTQVSFTAADPALPGGRSGSGVRRIEVAVDGGQFSSYGSALTFSEGAHTIEFRATDNVGNVEATRILRVRCDNTAPLTALKASGSYYSDYGPDGPRDFAPRHFTYTLPAVDPVVSDVASGLDVTRYGIDGGASQVFASPFTLAEGIRRVDFQSRDHVANLESIKTATIYVDATAPVTALSVIGGRQYPGPDSSTFYASSATRFGLPAADPEAHGVASGLRESEYQDNGAAFQAFGSPFGLSEGVHELSYRSRDRVLNLEVPRSTTVLVDATPPKTTAHVVQPFFLATDGTRSITPATPVTFTALDPTLPGTTRAGSQVDHIDVSVDGGAFIPYALPLTFTEGRHIVLYRSVDNVGNSEAAQTLEVQSDATAPLTALKASGAYYSDQGPGGQRDFAPQHFTYTLPATDPVVHDVASGLDVTRYGIDGGASQIFGSPFTLAEGIRRVDFLSQDHVANLESIKTATIYVDATAPVTALSIIGGRQYPGPDSSTFYASSATRFGLPAADPEVHGVASGLMGTEHRDNGAPFQAFGPPLAFSEGVHALSYRSRDRVLNLEVPRSTTVLVDATPPVTKVHVGQPLFVAADGTSFITPATPVTFTSNDPQLSGTTRPGAQVAFIEVSIDGGAFNAYASALTFVEGRHTVLFRAVDNVGNVEAVQTMRVRSDATAPVSALEVGAPQRRLSDGTLVVSSFTPVGIPAADPVVADVASGVKETLFRVSDGEGSTGAFLTFGSAFHMTGANVLKTIEFYSRDNVLNTEAGRSERILLDSTGPEVALISPPACESGICRVVEGRFPVLGTARDLHFAEYVLESAPGRDASTGFVRFAAGTTEVAAGSLGVWDARALSDWHTLRLTARDTVGNVTVLVLNVFVGDPATLMSLGNHETFNMPEGVAVGPDGRVYVADRNNDRVAMFSSTGTLLGSVAPALNKPQGVAVDLEGNLLIADTNNSRVVRVSQEGQVLLELARRNPAGHTLAGKGPGEFSKPSGVAVDGLGAIYVADTLNERIQIFSSSGVFVREFALPPAVVDGNSVAGQPTAIAVDAAGRVYVADGVAGRALRLTGTGALELEIPIQSEDGVRGTPSGIAVTPTGECIVVSDSKGGRVLKFDRNGAMNLAFGARGGDSRATAGVQLRKPIGLALESDGSLLVVDRNGDRIKRFGLPSGEATLVVPAPNPGDEYYVARDVIASEDGGAVERADKAGVIVPADALSEDLKITVSTPTAPGWQESSRHKAIIADKSLNIVSAPIEYQPHGTSFNTPVTLVIPYSADLVAAYKASEKSLKIHFWNPVKRQWEELVSEVDPIAGVVRAKTTHFSLYQVLASTATDETLTAQAAADESFAFRDLYVYPNPARGGSVPKLHLAVGVADKVSFRVFDTAGREVHRATLEGRPPVIDDGSGAKYAYEHAWEGHIPSGVYLFVVEAEKAGAAPIRKAGRFGVVR